MKIIKSYIAQHYWVKAHSLMGNQMHSLALVAIRKAVKMQPDEEKVPEYLELQGNIEESIGKTELALKTFRLAIEIINKFDNKNFKILKNRIVESIDKISGPGGPGLLPARGSVRQRRSPPFGSLRT